jgi:hypothetical protein
VDEAPGAGHTNAAHLGRLDEVDPIWRRPY